MSVPLMMTVKAVVTFENFRSDGIDPSNFVVPAEYQRSRRMSKERYIAGVVTGGAGAGGECEDRGNSGALDSDEEEEEGDFVDDVDEADLSDGELLRRRAAQRNAFEDDEVSGRGGGGGIGGGGGRAYGSMLLCFASCCVLFFFVLLCGYGWWCGSSLVDVVVCRGGGICRCCYLFTRVSSSCPRQLTLHLLCAPKADTQPSAQPSAVCFRMTAQSAKHDMLCRPFECNLYLDKCVQATGHHKYLAKMTR